LKEASECPIDGLAIGWVAMKIVIIVVVAGGERLVYKWWRFGWFP